MSKKQHIARFSVISNASLVALKLVVGLVSGSVSIISEAIHSFMDLIAAVIAFISVRISDNPPDKEHPYGHGKVENVSGVIEALLIFGASGWIIYEAIRKISVQEEIAFPLLGTAVMAVSAIVNTLVSRALYKVAKAEHSIALEADALHLKADVYTSAGVAIGMLLIAITDIHLFDPVAAIAIAIFILYEATLLLKKAFEPLLDNSLTDEEIAMIEETIASHKDVIYNYHELRTRRSGSTRYVDLHLELPRNLTVEQSHQICDEIEHTIKEKLKNTEVFIHVEPCPPAACAACQHKERSCTR